jgi:hypothetical protein
VLNPKNLVVKRIGGNKVKAKELLHYFKAYTAIYKGNELPEPKSMLEATAEANNLSAVAGAKDLYSSSMEEICGGAKAFMSTARIETEHQRVKDNALQLFQSKRKMGGDDFSTKYRDTLEQVFIQEKGFRLENYVILFIFRKLKNCFFISVHKMKAKIFSSLPEHRQHSSLLQLFSTFYLEYLDSLACIPLQTCSI